MRKSSLRPGFRPVVPAPRPTVVTHADQGGPPSGRLPQFDAARRRVEEAREEAQRRGTSVDVERVAVDDRRDPTQTMLGEIRDEVRGLRDDIRQIVHLGMSFMGNNDAPAEDEHEAGSAPTEIEPSQDDGSSSDNVSNIASLETETPIDDDPPQSA
jgi:hypothetical protein